MNKLFLPSALMAWSRSSLALDCSKAIMLRSGPTRSKTMTPSRRRLGGAFLALATASFSCAAFAEVDCGALDAHAESAATIVPDFGSGRDIVGRGRLQFYSAPDLQCKIDGLFVVPGDILFAQLEYNGFTRVAFIAMKKSDRGDVIAWVPAPRLKKNGKGIVPGAGGTR